ncbi:Tab2/Atab2 family RNA-binding protein [Anabaena sp. FACHB-1237]|uniref:Tab2/Atab2 family RNA-binding protein n=1 Tax=Anabaena sp. FACHB-1237 TaxID=2692769 RepID=UPI00167FEE1C|nr:Tab2/Atab2 family RNA-binding protein [Anabaena sp. FACHB-1237]MBD2138896.1 Tab2/Atab2 family RNA-binding protein [Anabaena sp. FACHB-1237]
MSLIWQVDFYRIPKQDNVDKALWALLICDEYGTFKYESLCPQSEASSKWLIQQFQLANKGILPDIIQVFRPQSLSLITAAADKLGIKITATRRTASLRKWLQDKKYDLTIDKLPPQPLPENLWGEQWRFVTINASDIIDEFIECPIPVLQMPDFLKPINLGLASNIPIPGVIIYGGRKSLKLTRWLDETNPVELKYVRGEPDGLILEAGLNERYILLTFTDKEVKNAAKSYEQKKQVSKGLHFLVVQPDDSGMTYSGLWLLKQEI